MDNSFFDLYTVRNLFDHDARRELIAEMRSCSASPALTYGKGDVAVDERVRRVRSVHVSPKSVEYITRRLEDQREPIIKHFGVNLTSFEKPQFLTYRLGDFFVAHQDGNTGLIDLDTDRRRLISVTIFLNNQSHEPNPENYGGGSLVLSDYRTGARYEVIGEAGLLVAFRSETTHEVTPVTRGERYVIVTWYEH